MRVRIAYTLKRSIINHFSTRLPRRPDKINARIEN